MGRYWEQAKRWFICKVWPFKTKERREEKISEVCPTCKSKIDVRRPMKICRCKETGSCQCGPKPTNVKTFAKRTKAAKGYAAGYMGKSINSEYGGVKLSNPSYVKYYKGMLS